MQRTREGMLRTVSAVHEPEARSQLLASSLTRLRVQYPMSACKLLPRNRTGMSESRHTESDSACNDRTRRRTSVALPFPLSRFLSEALRFPFFLSPSPSYRSSPSLMKSSSEPGSPMTRSFRGAMIGARSQVTNLSRVDVDASSQRSRAIISILIRRMVFATMDDARS